MSSRLFFAALVSVTLLGSVASAQEGAVPNAQARPVSIDQRMQWQLARIRQGVETGQITPAERRRLLAGEAAIRARVRELRQAGNGLSPAERQAVMRALNRLSVAIDQATHN